MSWVCVSALGGRAFVWVGCFGELKDVSMVLLPKASASAPTLLKADAAADPTPKKWKEPLRFDLKKGLTLGIKSHVSTHLGETVRILCLHDYMSTSGLFELSLGPLRAAATRNGKLKLELLFEDGPHIMSTRDAQSTGLINTMDFARVGGDHAPKALYSW